MKKKWIIMTGLAVLLMAAGASAQEKGGEGLDQEPSKPEAAVDLAAIAKQRMAAKRVLNTSTIADTPLSGGGRVVWSIGKKDGSSADLALGPDGFRQFLAHDFGFEDKSFVVGAAAARPAVADLQAGTGATWGGRGPTAG
ncbi:MAG: hypothetical protein LUH46_11175, partial [Alistipes sp.]|nr:hypothetical protein [Alistipes sp.]